MDAEYNFIERAQRKDADAFTELMQSCMQAMYKTARAMVKNDEDAADAISETILTCWEKMEQLKKPEFFKTWMTRILINECNDILRQRKRVCPVEAVEETAETTDAYENIEWLETLQGLDEKYRLVMILHYVNFMTATEIASVLHMPVSTVRTRLSRGRKQIAGMYDAGNTQTVKLAD